MNEKEVIEAQITFVGSFTDEQKELIERFKADMLNAGMMEIENPEITYLVN